jgi:hypothetical protein
MPKTTSQRHATVPAIKRNIPGPAKAPVTAPSVPVPSAQAPLAPSMFDTMKQGFSFGVGSSIAHNLFGNKNKDEVVNKKETPVEPKLHADKIYELYAICLDKNDNNIDCSKILEQANNI